MIFGKVMWVGRTAATLFGLALVMALVFGVATTAIGATGGNFILGKANAAGTPSSLAASIAKPTLTLINKSTDTAATALSISVDSGNAPLKVNAAAGTATGLSADELDGKDSAQFLGKTEKAADAAHADQADSATNAQNAVTLEGKTASEFAPSAHNHDERYYTEAEAYNKTEVNTALSGKANTSHQHSGADITSGTVEADRIEDGAGSNLNADQLDGKDSRAFGIRTAHNFSYAHDCDTADVWNECAPVTVTVPAGKTYYVSVWSSFTVENSDWVLTRHLDYCSAGKGTGIDANNPCITPFGVHNELFIAAYGEMGAVQAASSSGETNALSAGTYTFFTAIRPETGLQANQKNVVITKVMVRDATNGL